MVATLNYDAQKGFRELYQEDRWGVLSVLILHSNGSGRAWPTTKRIMNQLDRSPSIIIRARQWLIDHEAIELVPYDKREGSETKLPRRQYVYKLTGRVKLGNRYVPYLYAQEPKVEASTDPDDNDPDVSENEVSHSETFKSRTQTISNTEESYKRFFLPEAIYLINRTEKFIYDKGHDKTLIDIEKPTGWETVIGVELIHNEKYDEYKMLESLPSKPDLKSDPPAPPVPPPPRKAPVTQPVNDAIARHIQGFDPKLANRMTGILAQLAAGVWRKKLNRTKLTEDEYKAVGRSILKFTEWFKDNCKGCSLPQGRDTFENQYTKFVAAVSGLDTSEQDNLNVDHMRIL